MVSEIYFKDFVTANRFEEEFGRLLKVFIHDQTADHHVYWTIWKVNIILLE